MTDSSLTKTEKSNLEIDNSFKAESHSQDICLFHWGEVYKGYFVYPVEIFDCVEKKSFGFSPSALNPLTNEVCQIFSSEEVYRTADEAIAVAKAEVNHDYAFWVRLKDEPENSDNAHYALLKRAERQGANRAK